MLPVPGDESVAYALDPTKAQVTVRTLPHGEVQRLEDRSIVQLPVQFVYGLKALGDTRAVGLGLFPEGRIARFDAAGRLLDQVEGPFPFDPDRALFSERAELHDSGSAGYHGEFVHVFTWEGELADVFQWDRDVVRIDVVGDNSAIYATTEVPQPAVVRLETPKGPGSLP